MHPGVRCDYICKEFSTAAEIHTFEEWLGDRSSMYTVTPVMHVDKLLCNDTLSLLFRDM